MTREQLAKRIADLALLRGDFTLRSGRKSNYYLDKYRFETQPEVLRALGEMLSKHVTSEIDRIAGPELGAVALATAASLASGKPCVFVRNAKKEYGSSKQIEGILNAGDRVLLIEDIVTSGRQLVEAVKTLEATGAKVIKAICIIDREEGGREVIESAGIKFESLFKTSDLGIKT